MTNNKLDRFVDQEQLGEGAYGEVYKARGIFPAFLTVRQVHESALRLEEDQAELRRGGHPIHSDPRDFSPQRAGSPQRQEVVLFAMCATAIGYTM